MLEVLLTVTTHLLYINIIFISASILIPWSTKLLFPLGFYVSIVQCENTSMLCRAKLYLRGVAGSGCCSRLARVRGDRAPDTAHPALHGRHSAAVETRALDEGPHEGS